MKDFYIDFHTHSHLSDGSLSPQQLLDRAKAAGIRILAITDHNRIYSDLPRLQAQNPELQLVHGCEISCLAPITGDKETELHVVALNFDPSSPALQKVLKQNQPDRRPYIEAILQRLRECNIILEDYDTLQKQFPETTHFGRMNIAATMVKKGYVSSVNEAFDLYIGAHGERRAFVPNPLRYVSMEEAVSAIRSAGGIPVLAHLFYYLLQEQENHKLLDCFRCLAGAESAMEVNYGPYDAAQRSALKELAAKYGLMGSAASDFHGQNPEDRLDHHFPATEHLPLLECLGF
ncbi:MAG: PHP domain-containing protein [Oscillospiraceae bacterium]|nr:PHP domain-containing protein [Oscillospiraceae bacterium]